MDVSRFDHDKIHRVLLTRKLPPDIIHALARRHKELTRGEPNHKSPIALKLPTTLKSPLPWVGTKVRMAPFLSRMLKYEAPNAKVYCDPVAGSGSIPYLLRRHRQFERSVTNDISYLSYMAQRAFLCGERQDPRRDPNWLARRREGLLYNDKFGQNFSPEVRRAVDGYCDLHRENPLALVAAGIALTRLATFRGMALLASDAQKRDLTDWEAAVERAVERLLSFPRAPGSGVAFHGDYVDFMQSKLTEVVDVIAPDFADPWASGDTADQYLVPFWVGRILKQDESHVHPGVWTTTNVVKHLMDFCRVAVTRARLIVICSQSSNYPPPDHLPKIFGREFKVRDMYTLDRVSGLGSTKKSISVLREYFCLIEGQV